MASVNIVIIRFWDMALIGAIKKKELKKIGLTTTIFVNKSEYHIKLLH